MQYDQNPGLELLAVCTVPTVLYSVFRNSTKAALIVVGHTHLVKNYICFSYSVHNSHLKPFHIKVMDFT